MGLEQRKKFLTLTQVNKISDLKYEVTKAHANEIGLYFNSFIEAFQFLKIKFFTAGIMLGKSKGKTFYFDMEKNKSADYNSLFRRTIFALKTDKAEELVPFSTFSEKYIEKNWALSFLSSLGTTSRELYGIRFMPDDTIKRYFRYNTLHERINTFTFRKQMHQVWAELDFDDDKFKNVTSRKLYLKFEEIDQKATAKRIRQKVKKINTLVGNKRFLKFNPDFYTDSHLGKIHTNLHMRFTEKSLKCLLDKIGCAAKGPKAYKIGKLLQRAYNKSAPVKTLKYVADKLRKAIHRENKMRDFLNFIGPEPAHLDLHMFGEELPADSEIHLTHSVI